VHIAQSASNDLQSIRGVFRCLMKLSDYHQTVEFSSTVFF